MTVATTNVSRTMSSESVAKLICHQKFEAKVENIDNVDNANLDMRQDAATRAVIAFGKREIAYDGDDEFEARLVEHPEICFGVLQFARLDNMDLKYKHNGQSRGKKIEQTARTIRFGEAMLSPEEQSLLERTVDPDWERPFEEIDNDWGGELTALYEKCSPSQREALKLMAEVQRKKDDGTYDGGNDSLRGKLKRLRKATGWPLNTSLL